MSNATTIKITASNHDSGAADETFYRAAEDAPRTAKILQESGYRTVLLEPVPEREARAEYVRRAAVTVGRLSAPGSEIAVSVRRRLIVENARAAWASYAAEIGGAS